MPQWKFELLMKPPALPLTEGPVWDGEHLNFTHIQASRADCDEVRKCDAGERDSAPSDRHAKSRVRLPQAKQRQVAREEFSR